MPEGKLRSRAGIQSVAYVTSEENEATLGASAGAAALRAADFPAENLDWIFAASETFHSFPSLAATLHGTLGLREECAALDVGSGCLAVVQALATAQAILSTGQGNSALVVSADVHSRPLGPGRAAGEFGGLFGDGASAFLLSRMAPGAGQAGYRLGGFFLGCAAELADAIRVADSGQERLDVTFDGDALSRAAVSRMVRMVEESERRSGISRRDVGAFATHQPNPRLVTLLAKQLGVPPATFPPVATTKGNLGSSTCGVALDTALREAERRLASERQPIFLASLGPGLLFGGGWITPVQP